MKLDSRALQEYLEDLARHSKSADTEQKARELLRSYAELRYKMNGGKKCSMCRASVRHTYEVHAEYNDGSIREFECLCTRCLEGERGKSAKILLSIGDKKTEYPINFRLRPKESGSVKPVPQRKTAQRGR